MSRPVFILSLLLFLTVSFANAETRRSLRSVAAAPALRVPVTDSVYFRHEGDSVQLLMRVHLPKRVGKREVIILEPRLVLGSDSVDLSSVGVYGRTPYYRLIRSGIFTFQNPDDIMVRCRDLDRFSYFLYARKVHRRDWLEGAVLKMAYTRYTCCGDILEREGWEVAEARLFLAADTLVEWVPEVMEKHGTMHVDFVLDSINIRPDYHDNRRELARLDSALDSVLSDERYRIESLTLHGYASPEGPYRHNEWLAKNRTEALRRYIAERYPSLDTLIRTRHTAEDWEGLRAYVAASQLRHKDEIMAVFNDTVRWSDPDERLRHVRRTYREDFADIFDRSLPYLRHTDYTLRYTYSGQRELSRVIPPRLRPEEPLQPDEPVQSIRPLRPLFAVKTNLLFDAIAWPNVEVEVPIGRKARWSVMAEWGSPWYVWHHNSRAYEILNLGVEVRRWMRKCDGCRPALTGSFLGLYACGGKYDIEWNSSGDQGEYASFGLSYGYSWILGKCWNLELSGSAGVVFGPQRHYNGEFDDTHLIFKHFDNLFYAGLTQLKLSIVWLIPRKWFGLKE